MKATIFDYGAGNLHSLAKALSGAEVGIEPDPLRAIDTDLLVLPGVGAFAAAAASLAPGRKQMRAALDSGLPCVGICLGMQLLFDASEEGPGEGLGILPGQVTKLRARRIPQIGWNTLEEASDPLFERAPLPIAYFANGYACRPEEPGCVTAWSTHEGDRFPAAVRRGSVLGVQFHPEKSSSAGVRFLGAFLEEVARCS
ncbi:MAG: imidazole glycerol phosphate synthase subunit HisH [Candidatus Eisenbacteria bacterium]|uniref:Imidazole glycerol phosphate synthase subunit HisH n=1 Tax=Eiseniibacteriota bacterium TaxID=2212470 RepID=A0A538SLG9_UNCEI|nr:MAG: imidazole glycerol phosphate synthase subunit HisH [Candidatus Eisenbacteria bacterium]